jgi:arylsulfatase
LKAKTALLYAVAAVALGGWLLLEPLWRFGGSCGRLGQPLGMFLLIAASVGLALGLAALVPAARADRRWRTRLGLALEAAALAALILFWTLRETTPALFGLRHRLLYAALALAGAAVVLAVGHALRRSRLLVLAPLAGLVLYGLFVAAFLSSRRESALKPGQVAWKGAPVRRVLLITIDALRADHVGAYGYPRGTTPVLDRLAREGILFRNAYAQGNRSELSFGALLTGLLPSAHGVSREKGMVHPLSPEVTTLTEAMARHGFVTVGLLSNPYLKSGWGLDQGFQLVDEFSFHYRRLLLFRLVEKLGLLREPEVDIVTIPRGPEVTRRALRLLRRAGDRPLFALIHYMDVHHPYWPPDSLVARFRRPGSSDADPRELFRRITSRRLDEPGPERLAPADLQRLVDLYDGTVAFADAEVGRLLETLESWGWLDDALVVVTADHGDEFGEHGYLFHANPVPTESLTRIPLILWSPKLWPEPQVVDQPVSQVDLLPTLVRLLGLEPVAPVQGGPLPLPGWGEGVDSTAVVSEGPDGWAVLRETGPGGWWKLWRAPEGPARLYRIDTDPGETRDLATRWPERTAGMSRRLEEILARSRALTRRIPRLEMDRMTMEELRSLGYIRGPAQRR